MGWDAIALGRSFVSYMAKVFEDARAPGEPQRRQSRHGSAFEHAAAVFAASWRTAVGMIGLVAAWMERAPG